jgi:hypothetical protein
MANGRPLSMVERDQVDQTISFIGRGTVSTRIGARGATVGFRAADGANSDILTLAIAATIHPATIAMLGGNHDRRILASRPRRRSRGALRS